MAEETPKAQPAAPNSEGEEPKDAPTGERRSPEAIREDIVAALKTVYDPEIPVDIYELGLIYAIEVDEAGAVEIRMTLTAPGCPVAGWLPGEVEQKAAAVPGVSSVRVDLVWDPPWDPSKMSEAARLQLGF